MNEAYLKQGWAGRCWRRVAVPSFYWLLAGWLLASGDSGHMPRPQRGYTYSHDVNSEVPWSIHILKVDRSRTDLTLHSVLGQNSVQGMATVPDQVKGLPASIGRPLAAINGDFYKNSRNYPGDPEGLQIMEGELISSPHPSKVCLWIDPAGAPHRTNVTSQFHVTWPDGSRTPFNLNEERDGTAVLYTSAIGKSTRTSGGVELLLEVSGPGPKFPLRAGETYETKITSINSTGDSAVTRDSVVLSLGSDLVAHVPSLQPGAIVKISTTTMPDLKGVQTAIGGGPTLVQDGKARTWSGSQARHPRTAVGWNKDYLYFLVVDGRQRNLSVGMTFPELAEYMATKLGCEEALNLDGGGSATFWIYGNVVNNPSEGKERPAANALVLTQEAKKLNAVK